MSLGMSARIAEYRNHRGLGTCGGFLAHDLLDFRTGIVDSPLCGGADMCGEVWRYATPDSLSGNSGYRVSSNRVLHC